MPPEALPVKFTVRGACPEVGEAEAFAVIGDGAADTVMVTDLLAVAEALSLTVSVAVQVPEDW